MRALDWVALLRLPLAWLGSPLAGFACPETACRLTVASIAAGSWKRPAMQCEKICAADAILSAFNASLS